MTKLGHATELVLDLLRIQVSVQILILLIFYPSQFIHLIFIHASICSQPEFFVTFVTVYFHWIVTL